MNECVCVQQKDARLGFTTVNVLKQRYLGGVW